MVILGHFLVILGHFLVILGHFVAIFLEVINLVKRSLFQFAGRFSVFPGFRFSSPPVFRFFPVFGFQTRRFSGFSRFSVFKPAGFRFFPVFGFQTRRFSGFSRFSVFKTAGFGYPFFGPKIAGFGSGNLNTSTYHHPPPP